MSVLQTCIAHYPCRNLERRTVSLKVVCITSSRSREVVPVMMQGAVLVGETELEETFEHLILDGLDLTRYGPDLLSPDVDLEMIFD